MEQIIEINLYITSLSTSLFSIALNAYRFCGFLQPCRLRFIQVGGKDIPTLRMVAI